MTNIKRRSAAKVGDVIAVTGKLGISSKGLVDIMFGDLNTEAARIHRMAQARVTEGVWLGEQKEVHAMMDISDGIASDIKHIMGQSAVGAEIELSKVANPRLGYGDVVREVEARGGATLANIRDAICSIRRSKLPDTAVLGNAGSFFKNPVVERELAERLLAEYPDMPLYPAGEEGKAKLAAGWLIDRTGWKGKSDGRVGVHTRQALVLINLGGATGAEVMELAYRIVTEVKERFGVELSPEVNVL